MNWWREKKKKKKRNLKRGAKLLEELIECCDGKSNPIKFFSIPQILKATNNLNDSYFVFGSRFSYAWFKGENENDAMILIRKGVDIKGNFYRDIAVSSMVSGHKNFMKLVGCCLEFKDPVLVYNGVKTHAPVHLIISVAPWYGRMKIAEDIATALAYLHTAFPRPFVYRSLVPDNVLLDEDLVAKLSDFSGCVSIPEGKTFVKVNRIYCGDIYKDSKYWRDGVVSVETDVYAFGMLMQMLLHGCHEVWVDKLFHRITRKQSADRYAAKTDFVIKYTQYWLLKRMKEGRMEDIFKTVNPEMLKTMGLISEEELRNGFRDVGQLSHRITGEEISDDSITEREDQKRQIQDWLLKHMEEGKMHEIADPEMLEKMGEISEKELSQMKAFLMLSQRCIGLQGEVPTMVEVAKELKKIQRSLKNDSSSPSGESQFHSPQDIASSSQTRF
ncbi:Inactive serine/threonine-protein kinase ZRK12 [Cardamine amara subsp. amara]|uniref:Inactive serine/threonine-protein kinase ZRK12 n=1 Tax=Cardamine amara subsp. amara TaxID=228776 RepID=A0ABD1BLF0_CARAN